MASTLLDLTAGIISPTNSPPPQQTIEHPEENDSSVITREFQDLEISETPTAPEKGLTENHSATYLSSGNPCLDFFFHVVPDTPPDSLRRRLESAWAHHPLTALKLVFNLRGVRGSGKSDREGFYTAALWLHHHHPKTLALNSNAVASFGYFKDLPEILYRLLEGSESRQEQKEEWRMRKNRKGVKGPDKETARAQRKARELAKVKRALERYEGDENYRVLYDSVCDVFAETLRSDAEFLKLGETGEISLASKWCPSVDSAYDKTILICEGIAKRIFPREKFPRDRLRKEVLVPLRRSLQLPEVSMSAGEWSSLPYGRVASVAMKNYKKTFLKRDRERFEGFLEEVKSGKAKVAAGALLPHELLASLDDVAELQWERMVKDLRVSGKLSGCVAVCDVSGSMFGIPMEVCVALGLLVSELNEGPWKGKVITFSESPEIHTVEGDTLAAKAGFLHAMDWGMNTDFQKVFDLLLEFGGDRNDIPKRVFVFSDMEFDQACFGDRSWETDYEVIVRKFRDRGFESPPELVFWNLRDTSSTPVTACRPGVALVSGFSKNLLTLFLEGGGIVDPEKVMDLAIAREEYNKLTVYD